MFSIQNSRCVCVYSDVNDNPPFFVFPQMAAGAYYENSVMENFLPTSPVFTIVASDKDKERNISYSMEDVSVKG